MKRFYKLLALISALMLLTCSIPVVTVSAAYENTHVNTGNQAADIVAVAATQVGYLEGSLAGTTAGSNNYQKYGLWYDNNVDYIGVTKAAWCAAFVSWCANQAGIPSSTVYYHAYCPYGVTWFKNQGLFQYSAYRGGSYTPKAGDIIYFQSSTVASHVGIVRYSSGGYVYTIEGNTSGQNGEVNEGGGVFAKKYSLSYSNILGYGTPNYTDNSGYTITFESNGGSSVDSVNVKDGATLSEPTAPTRYGFDFAGWYCNPELTDPYDFSTTVSYDFTLYAKWDEAYWGANTDLMPNSGQLQFNSFNSDGETVWPYWNDDEDGSVTLYNAVANDDDNWSWPSAYMEYANSFDAANDAYIYVKKDGTAQFNAVITYLDGDGNSHDVSLSQLAGNGDNDFEAGYMEFFVNIGNYIASQGHLPESGNVKFTKVTYYVVGELDSYVQLYDMKLTPEFELEDPYKTLYNADVHQNSGVGSYTYSDGELVLNATTDSGYSVTVSPNLTFNPTEMVYLLADLNSTVDYNISMVITRADGEATLEFRKEFFDVFGYTEAPTALPAGTFQNTMNINGYYYWNGGLLNESTIKSVTISLVGQGTLSLNALQVSKKTSAVYVRDGAYSTGSLSEGDTPIPLTLSSKVYTVASSMVSNVTAGMTVDTFIAGFDQTDIAVYDTNNDRLDSSAAITSGMTVCTTTSGAVRYTIIVTGDVNGDGVASTADARAVLSATLGNTTLNDWQTIAADFDNNEEINTSDVRALLSSIVR